LTLGIVHILLILGAAVIMVPFAWTLSTSLKDADRVFQWPPTFFQPPFRWENYPTALSSFPFLLYLRNTMVITTLTIVGRLLSCSLVAYGFARREFKGRDTLFLICLSTMMLPFQVTMIPLYIIFHRLKWVNTFYPFVVPAFFGTAFFIFLLRQFFTTISVDLEDAARIDGCSEFRVYWQIILPLSLPALAAVTIFTFMWTWNDFLGPLIYLTKDNVKTLQLGLMAFQQQYSVRWHLLMAASVVLVLPCLLLFFFTQRYFIQGVVFTGVKG
jgi:ABC-type glycerol-3-phosphate transport system permease component